MDHGLCFTTNNCYSLLGGNVFLSETTNDDASDEDENDKEQYHPRCLLLSGPPQVCKALFIIYLCNE